MHDPDLWTQIEAHVLPFRSELDDKANPPRNCTCFEHNLRKAGDWTDASARLLVREYRRFLYLKARVAGDLTPPDCIDQVWHLHLEIDPRNMAALGDAIGRPITHSTGMSESEALASYARLLDHYRGEFGQMPDPQVWPSLWRVRMEPVRKRIAWICWTTGLAGLGLLLVAGMVLRSQQVGFGQVMDELAGAGLKSDPAFAPYFVLSLTILILAALASAFAPAMPQRIARCG